MRVAGVWGASRMDAVSQNHLDFVARVARVKRNLASSEQLLFVGVDEVYSMPRRERKASTSRGRAMFGNLIYPMSMVAAVLLGAVSHGLGQVARFHIQGMPDLKANPDIEMLVQTVLGILILMVLGFVLGLNSKTFTTLKSVGVVVGLLTFHNAVHLWPRLFAVLTSEIWVNQVITTTKLYSVVWRGISFVL